MTCGDYFNISRDWCRGAAGRASFQGPKVSSCLTLGTELSKETGMLTKQETTGKGRPGKEQKAKGTQENCFATWLEVLGFMAIRLLSGLSLSSCSDSGSFLVVHALLSQDGGQ